MKDVDAVVIVVGVLALLYVCARIDETQSQRRRLMNQRDEKDEPPGADMDIVFISELPECPRCESLDVVVRSDGALWCMGCDEAFFPTAEAA